MKKLLLTSILSVVMCMSLIAGATFALFTSESKVNVAVTSGTVNVSATASDLELYSRETLQPNDFFENGGTAKLTENSVVIDKITPMDEVRFNITVNNYSDVNYKYQAKLAVVGEYDLMPALTIETYVYNADGTIDEDSKMVFDGLNGYSDWISAQPSDNDAQTAEVITKFQMRIIFKDHGAEDNKYMNKGIKLAYSVFAVQGNAETESIKDYAAVIYSAEDLRIFANAVNAGNNFKGKTVKLMEDIDLNNILFTPIGLGNANNDFRGTFDGGNHTISNLKVDNGKVANAGLFGFTQEGAVKNLTIKNATVSGRTCVGVVAGTPYTSEYSNITVKGHVEVNGLAYVGGVGGKNVYANWDNITVDVDDTSYVKAISIENGNEYRTYVGGVIGFMGEGNHVISNVTSNIDVIGSTQDVGGITGIAHYGNTFKNVVCTGDVTAEADNTETGGIAGTWNNNPGYVNVFEYCTFTGTVTVNGVVSNNTLVGAAYTPNGTGKYIVIKDDAEGNRVETVYELKAGVAYKTDADTNECTLTKVPESFTNSTFVVDEGVDTIGGYAFAYNTNIETIILPSTVTTLDDRAFRDTSATTVVLNEGLTNISYQAFRNATNVENVVIPSTVTTISKEAFQNSGIKTLSIPANVTTIEYGGLRDMKELVSVAIAGNVDIPVYAFRACTNLKTVYIFGEDVTFGGGSRGMIFTNKENGDGSAITIYVANETVKERLLAADTAARDYGGYTIVVDNQVAPVESAQDLAQAIAQGEKAVLTRDIVISELSRAATTGIVVNAGETATIDLNGNTLSFVTANGEGNVANRILVKGTLNVIGGTITTEHAGTDLAWGGMSTIFEITAGGVVNVKDSTLKNLGGTSMAFVAHLNNWGSATLNAENTTFESTYMAIRVFNSGYDMNNVTLKNCNVHGNSYALWVHNYTAADFGASYDAEAVEARLNFDIFNGTNTLTAGVNKDNFAVIRYGFTNAITADARGYRIVSDFASLQAYTEAGYDVVFANDIDGESNKTAPYGNKYAVKQVGGTIDGNGYTLSVPAAGDNYVIITYGGTIKNLKIDDGFRGVVLYSPVEDVIIDNCVIVGNVCYPINTAEHPTVDGIDLIVSNSTLGGWTSFAGVESVTFKNCDFVNGEYYGWPYACLIKPYVNTEFVGCSFGEGYYLDLSALGADCTVTLTDCEYAGSAIEDMASWDFSCESEDAFNVELPNGRNAADCIIVK